MQRPRARKALKNQKGFTLIEIIAVLVILGILAAVAIPKYFDMQSEAKNKALEGAMAEARGRINSYFGKRLLKGDAWDAITYDSTSIGDDLGDFTLSINSSGNSLTLTVAGKTPTFTPSTDSITITMDKPGAP